MANILILDDQLHIQELLQEEMLKQGHSLATLYGAELAKVYLKHAEPDLVLLDPYLDGFQGWDLLHDIKEFYPNLPVLVVTDYEKIKNRIAEFFTRKPATEAMIDAREKANMIVSDGPGELPGPDGRYGQCPAEKNIPLKGGLA